MERTLLVRNAQVLVTMDEKRREIRDGALFVKGNRIEAVGATSELLQCTGQADEVPIGMKFLQRIRGTRSASGPFKELLARLQQLAAILKHGHANANR